MFINLVKEITCYPAYDQQASLTPARNYAFGTFSKVLLGNNILFFHVFLILSALISDLGATCFEFILNYLGGVS